MTRGAIWLYLALLGGTLALAACGTREEPLKRGPTAYFCIDGHLYGKLGAGGPFPLFDEDDRPTRCKP